MRHGLTVGVLLMGLTGVRAADPPPLAETIGALVQKLAAQNPTVRLQAIRDLGKLGKAARPAVPALLKTERDKDSAVGRRAAFALAQIGALPELIQGVQDKDVRVRARSIHALAWFGPEAKEAVPVVTAALKDRNDSVRVAAIQTLGEIGPDAKEAVSDLARLLRAKSVRHARTGLTGVVQARPGCRSSARRSGA